MISVKNSYIDLVHIKPFIYGPAYVNGVLVSYLLTHNLMEKIYLNKITSNIIIFMKVFLILFALVAYSQVLTIGLPLFNAIESSSFSPLMTAIITYHLINIAQFDSIWKRLLTKTIWIPMRSSMRMAYLIYPVILSMIADLFPDIDVSNIFVYLMVSIVFVIMTYILAIPMTIVFEMPLIGLSSRLTEHLFQIEEKDLKIA